MKIDSHQHFWQYDPDKHIWMSSEMALLKQDYLPSDLKNELVKNGLDGCVSVQASQSEGETEFLLKLASENEFIKGVVGWVDFRADNISDRLAYYANSDSKIKGFRHVIHDEPDVDFMLGKAFQHGLSFLANHHFTYDLLIFPKHLKASLELINNFPYQKFVIDHIAKPPIAKGEIDDWKKYMRTIGKNEQVYCKLSGMVTEANLKNWKYEDFVPYLDVVVESFGMERIMFGSDWPVCLLSCDYNKMKGIVDRYISEFSPANQEKILGLNAIKFYSL